MAGLPLPPEFQLTPDLPGALPFPEELAYEPQPQIIDGTLPPPTPIAPMEPAFPAATVSQGLPVPPEFVYQPEQAPAPLAAAPVPAPVAAPPPTADQRPPELVARDQATGADDIISATYQAGDARAQKADALAARRQQDADADLARIDRDEQWETQKRAELDEAYQRHSVEVDRLANAKVDPKRMAKEQGYFEKFATAIGFLAGGVLSVRNGSGRNEFAEFHRGMVDDDLRAQELELSNRRAAVGMKGNLLGDLRAQFGDDRAAKAAFRAVRADQAAKQLEAYAAQFDSPIIQKDLALQAAELRSARDKEIGAATQQQWENNFKTRQLNEQVRSNRAGEKLARDRMQAEKDAAGAEDQGIPIRGPSGNVYGYATSPDRADRVKKSDEATKIVENQARTKVLFEEAKELFKDGWDKNPWSERRKRQEKMAADWVNARKTSTGDFSAPNAADWEAYGIRDGWGPDNPLVEFEQGYKNSRISGAAALTSRGISNEALVAEGLSDPPDFEAKAVRPGELPGKSVGEIVGDVGEITGGGYVPIVDTADGTVTYRSPEAVQFLSRYGGRYRPANEDELKTARAGAEKQAKDKQVTDAKREAFRSGMLK
jgi:hypothetical protein